MTKTAIPFHTFSENGPVIHFAHANGFPPKSYQAFLQPFLKNHTVIASDFRPLWGNQDYNKLNSWSEFADDLIQFLEERSLKNVIGMGHSLGGVSTVLAAMKRPDLFSKLILIDPVIFDTPLFYLLKYFPKSIKKKIVPVAKVALKRRNTWDSKEEVYQLWRKKRVFKKIPDEVLKNMIEHGIKDDVNKKFTLAYSREWEAQVYITAPLFFKQLIKVKTPMTIVRGDQSSVLTDKVWEAWKSAQPNNHFINVMDAGHLVPFEKPNEVASEIIKFL